MTPEEAAAEVRRLELATRRLVRDLVAGDYASAFRGRGIEFADLREYQPGDDVRAIDWRITARLGAPQVRVQREERELSLLLVADESASGDVASRRRSKRELASELAAVLALAAARGNDRVGLALVTDRVESLLLPKKGRRHALRALNELLRYRPAARGTDLAAALASLEGDLVRPTVIILLSDFQDEGFELPLARLARRHEVVCLQLADGLELALPDAGLLALEDPERRQRLLVDTSDPRVRRAYEAARRAFDVRVAAEIVAAGAEHLRLDAAQPYAEPLVTFFRRRAKRG